MNWTNLHVLERKPAPVGQGKAVARAGESVGGNLVHLPVSTGSQQDHLGVKEVNLPGRKLIGNNARNLPVPVDEIEHMEFRVNFYTLLHRIEIERIHDNATRAVGGVADALNGRFAKISGMTPKATLGNFSFRCAVEGNPHVRVLDGPDGVFGKNFGGVLVG